MAMQTANPFATPSAHVVGSAFVEQYYHILHASPELVYRFYLDSSTITRPNANGEMISATTMQGINDLILSLDHKNCKAEIKSADAQESYNNGVTVLVTGCLTGKDDIQRKFAQSFFLAPQDKGYFVFSDVFRYFEEKESFQTNPLILSRQVESAESNNLATVSDPTHISEHPVTLIESATLLVEESNDNGEEVYNPSDNGEGSVVDVEVVVELAPHSIQNDDSSITEAASSVTQEDAPKKSYASIVKVMKGIKRPTPVYVPANSARVTSGNAEQPIVGSATPTPGPEASTPSNQNATATSVSHEEVEGHSIYIRSLPMNASVPQIEEEFKKFGPIKLGGVQVRSNRQHCFGFVEFEDLSSMQSAIKASPIIIGGRQSFIEQKRTTSRVVGGRVRFSPNRGGVRNDNFRGHGNFGGGRGYGRSDFGNRGEFSGRGRGPSGRGGGESYQRVNPSGSGRGGRQSGAASQTNNS